MQVFGIHGGMVKKSNVPRVISQPKLRYLKQLKKPKNILLPMKSLKQGTTPSITCHDSVLVLPIPSPVHSSPHNRLFSHLTKRGVVAFFQHFLQIRKYPYSSAAALPQAVQCTLPQPGHVNECRLHTMARHSGFEHSAMSDISSGMHEQSYDGFASTRTFVRALLF
jgi:hypothetical protein